MANLQAQDLSVADTVWQVCNSSAGEAKIGGLLAHQPSLFAKHQVSKRPSENLKRKG